MRQETAVERIDRRIGERRRISTRTRQDVTPTAAPAPDRYVDRHAPGVFAKWWAGMVATAPDLVRNGTK